MLSSRSYHRIQLKTVPCRLCTEALHKLMQRQGSKQDFLKFLHDAVTQMVASRHVCIAARQGLTASRDLQAAITIRLNVRTTRGPVASAPPSRRKATYAGHVAGRQIRVLPSKQLGFVRPVRQYLVCVLKPVVSGITTSNSTTRSRPNWQRSRIMCDVGLIMRVQCRARIV